MLALALAGLGVSSYLAVVSLQQGSVVGCSGESSWFACDEVLTSRWSKWLEIPVSALAAALYIGLLLALPWTGAGQLNRVRRRAWTVVLALALAAGLAGVWFVGLQVFSVGELCMYCLAAHACGVAVAVLAFIAAPVGANSPEARLRLNAGAVGVAGTAAVAGMVVLITGQLWHETPAFKVENLANASPTIPANPNTDGSANHDNHDDGNSTAPDLSENGNDDRIVLATGRVVLRRGEFPTVGPRDAPVVVAKMFDYTCSHCRRLHQHLRQVRERYGDQLAIVLLPVPLNPQCNEHVTGDGSSHQNACQLAKLALAVWRADPGAFEEYHDWLFASFSPRATLDAREKADELVGADNLNAAMDQIDAQLSESVEMYAAVGAKQVPKLLAAKQIQTGAPRQVEQVYGFLEQFTSLEPPAGVDSSLKASSD